MGRSLGLQLALVAAVVAGCGSDGAPNADAIPAKQAKALADGVVTYDEYSTAYDDLVACLNDRDFDVSEPFVDPPNSPYLSITIDSPDLSSSFDADENYGECYVANAAAVSAAWADLHTDPNDPLSNGYVYEYTVECLERRLGVTLDDVDPSSPVDLDRLIAEYGEPVYESCFVEAVDSVED